MKPSSSSSPKLNPGPSSSSNASTSSPSRPPLAPHHNLPGLPPLPAYGLLDGTGRGGTSSGTASPALMRSATASPFPDTHQGGPRPRASSPLRPPPMSPGANTLGGGGDTIIRAADTDNDLSDDDQDDDDGSDDPGNNDAWTTDLLNDWHVPPGARRRPFFALRPRPVPSIIYFCATILFLYLAGRKPPAGSLVDISPGFQSLVNMAMPLLVIFVKQIWIPNPKDDMVTASWQAHAQRYAVVGGAWAVAGWIELIALRQVGPVALVPLKSVLPVLVLVMVKRFSVRSVQVTANVTERLIIGLVGTCLGMFLFALALSADDPTRAGLTSGGLLAGGILAVALRAYAMVWMERYFMENETDPWVLANYVSPPAAISALVLYVFFDHTLPSGPWFASTVRTGLLATLLLLSSTFLLQHISSFALALLLQIVHVIFLVFFWQIQGIDMAWYGLIGVIAFTAAIRLVTKSTSGHASGRRSVNGRAGVGQAPEVGYAAAASDDIDALPQGGGALPR